MTTKRPVAAVAVALAISMAGCGGGSLGPSGNSAVSPGPPPSLPGTPGHFDDGIVSFEQATQDRPSASPIRIRCAA